MTDENTESKKTKAKATKTTKPKRRGGLKRKSRLLKPIARPSRTQAANTLLDTLLYTRKINVDQAGTLRAAFTANIVGTLFTDLFSDPERLERFMSMISGMVAPTPPIVENPDVWIPKPVTEHDFVDEDASCGEEGCSWCRVSHGPVADAAQEGPVADAAQDDPFDPHLKVQVCHVDDTSNGPPAGVWIHADEWKGEFNKQHIAKLLDIGAMWSDFLTEKQTLSVFVPQKVGSDVEVKLPKHLCGPHDSLARLLYYLDLLERTEAAKEV